MFISLVGFSNYFIFLFVWKKTQRNCCWTEKIFLLFQRSPKPCHFWVWWVQTWGVSGLQCNWESWGKFIYAEDIVFKRLCLYFKYCTCISCSDVFNWRFNWTDCCFVLFYIKGKLVYANYGRLEDLDVVLKKDIELNGSVLLLRKGKISYAEKVQVCSSPSWATVVVWFWRDPSNVIWCFSGGHCCSQGSLCCSHLPRHTGLQVRGRHGSVRTRTLAKVQHVSCDII